MAAQFFIVIALAAAAQSSLLPALEQTDYDVTDFEYNIADANTGDFKSQAETRIGDTVRGQYTVLQPDGIKRIVHYTAGDEGFNAVVINKPPVVIAISKAPALIEQAPVLIGKKPAFYGVPESSFNAQSSNYVSESNGYLPPHDPIFKTLDTKVPTTLANTEVPNLIPPTEAPLLELKHTETPNPQNFGLKTEAVAHSSSSISSFSVQSPPLISEASALPPALIGKAAELVAEAPARAIVNSFSFVTETPSQPSGFAAQPTFLKNESVPILETSKTSILSKSPAIFEAPAASGFHAKSPAFIEVLDDSAFFKNPAYASLANPPSFAKNHALAIPAFFSKIPSYEAPIATGFLSRAPGLLTGAPIRGSTFVSSLASSDYARGPNLLPEISTLIGEAPANFGTPTYATSSLYSQHGLSSPSFLQPIYITAPSSNVFSATKRTSPFSYGADFNSYGWK